MSTAAPAPAKSAAPVVAATPAFTPAGAKATIHDHNPAAPGLTPAQVREYNENGFLIFNDVLTPAEVETLRAAAASPEVHAHVYGKNDYADTATIHALEITMAHPAFLDLARHPAIVAKLIALIGPDIQLQHSKLAVKPSTPGTGGFQWHQDFGYFPHSNTSLAAVMVMLDDATPDNGCMSMVIGSHKLGLLNHTNAKGLFSGGCREDKYTSDSSKVAEITPRAGGISIHHALTLHGSPVNRSGKPRRGVVYQYRADDAYQLCDGIWKDTGIMVAGTRKELVRCDAGTVRLAKSRRYDGSPFGGAWNQDGEYVKKSHKYL
ncbi:MAG TPA: phytanoyl-CoA dioxygenase family protein [Planctomycetota bacterium]|nr:phytanoyl-CoA dioxygenase family protein [Planctomycetota bacterium]